MKVGIIQPNYIPWRGYFDFISSVDKFIILDDVQYTPRDWRNRNQIKSSKGNIWITVPVKYEYRQQLITDIKIDYTQNWIDKHYQALKSNYSRSPYYSLYIDQFVELLNRRYEYLVSLDIELIKWIMSLLSIDVEIYISSKLSVAGKKTEKLINLVLDVGGTEYLSGPSAAEYLDLDLFRKNNIGLEYKNYNYEQYKQLWGNFSGNVSILDLLFNMGPDAKNLISTMDSNTRII